MRLVEFQRRVWPRVYLPCCPFDYSSTSQLLVCGEWNDGAPFGVASRQDRWRGMVKQVDWSDKGRVAGRGGATFTRWKWPSPPGYARSGPLQWP